jgi:hypothetical protein
MSSSAPTNGLTRSRRFGASSACAAEKHRRHVDANALADSDLHALMPSRVSGTLTIMC